MKTALFVAILMFGSAALAAGPVKQERQFKLTELQYLGSNKYKVRFSLQNSQDAKRAVLDQLDPGRCAHDKQQIAVNQGRGVELKMVIDASDQCGLVDFNMIHVENKDSSLEKARTLYQSIYLAQEKQKIDFIEANFQLKNESERRINDYNLSLHQIVRTYDVSLSVDARNLVGYKGVQIRNFVNPNYEVTHELMSEDPQELAAFIQSYRTERRVLWTQHTSKDYAGCFPLMGCAFEWNTAEDEYRRSFGHEVDVVLIRKNSSGIDTMDRFTGDLSIGHDPY